jgi:hypothetical protein
MENEVKVEKSGSGAPAATNKRGGYKGKYKSTTGTTMRSPKFDGKCDSLKGFVFDCVDGRQSDSYNVDTKEVAEYVGR